MSWSSGKDGAYALHLARADPSLEVVGLLTTLDEAADRVAMHGVRHALVRRQAASLALPLRVVALPQPCSNAIYEARLGEALAQARAEGVEVMIFGDLFLADIRAYREGQLAETGIEARFPLWGRDTRALAAEMLGAGMVATLTCVDRSKLPIGFVGRRWDAFLLRELPEGVDPCGEQGEFHTFVSDGPGFSEAINWQPGEVVEREGFGFADLVPS